MRKYNVSIHAPLARGDDTHILFVSASSSFNPRPSCEGRRSGRSAAFFLKRFQSTPLLRGATKRNMDTIMYMRVSIHAPLARGDTKARSCHRSSMSFNPRPSCEGRQAMMSGFGGSIEFQSTPLLRGATLMTSQS